jgi:hypothetical protein
MKENDSILFLTNATARHCNSQLMTAKQYYGKWRIVLKPRRLITM